MLKNAFTPALFDPDFSVWVQTKVASAKGAVNHSLVRLQCESTFLEGLDLHTLFSYQLQAEAEEAMLS